MSDRIHCDIQADWFVGDETFVLFINVLFFAIAVIINLASAAVLIFVVCVKKRRNSFLILTPAFFFIYSVSQGLFSYER